MTLIPDSTTPVMRALLNTLALHGQCRLNYVDTTHIRLDRFNGSLILINGTIQQIPLAGVILASTGLSATTLYYIYAWMNGATMTLEASTTVHSTDSTIGIEIKTGDATRTLVGMVYCKTAATFANTTVQRLVASWFNRRPRNLRNTYSTNRLFSNTGSFAEINSEIRVEFLSWDDAGGHSPVPFTFSGWMDQTSAVDSHVGVAVDGTSVSDGYGGCSATLLTGICHAGCPEMLSEGYHFLTLIGSVSAATTVTIYYQRSYLCATTII